MFGNSCDIIFSCESNWHEYCNAGFLLHLDPTDDELALIFGHEISHLLLEHTEHQVIGALIRSVFPRLLFLACLSPPPLPPPRHVKMTWNAIIAVAQLVLLVVIDPTDLLTLAAELFGFELAKLSKAQFSRECECEADSVSKIENLYLVGHCI